MPETQTPYRVSALKYRPQTLEEVIGQDVLVQTIKNSFRIKRIPHAFVFTGVRGVGKTSTARLLARGLNCVGADGAGDITVNPCGQCPPCLDILSERSLDVMEVDAASRTGVDDVRQLIENVAYRPLKGRYKIYIIDEVHMLSKSAFNALLKTLEEPPAHAKFFFATTEIDKVPTTILSRCQRFDLKRMTVPVLKDYLTSILKKEGVKADSEAVDLLVHAADGSVRDALSLMDQAINMAGGDLTAATVHSMLGHARLEDVGQLLEDLFKGLPMPVLDRVRGLYQEGIAALSLCNRLLHIIHKLSLSVMTEGREGDLPDRLSALAKELTLPTLTRAWQLILKGMEEIKSSPDELMALEMVCLRFCYLKPVPDLGALYEPVSSGVVGGADSGLAALKASAKATGSSSAIRSAEKSEEGPQGAGYSQVSAAPKPEPYLEKVSAPRKEKVIQGGESASKETGGLAPEKPAQEAGESADKNPETTDQDEWSVERLVELAYTHQEPLVASYLTQAVAVETCGLGSLTYHVVNRVPDTFKKDLQKKLVQWTDHPWEIREVEQGEGITLQKKQEMIEKKKLQDYEQGETFKNLQAVFPEARVTRIVERTEI